MRGPTERWYVCSMMTLQTLGCMPGHRRTLSISGLLPQRPVDLRWRMSLDTFPTSSTNVGPSRLLNARASPRSRSPCGRSAARLEPGEPGGDGGSGIGSDGWQNGFMSLGSTIWDGCVPKSAACSGVRKSAARSARAGAVRTARTRTLDDGVNRAAQIEYGVVMVPVLGLQQDEPEVQCPMSTIVYCGVPAPDALFGGARVGVLELDGWRTAGRVGLEGVVVLVVGVEEVCATRKVMDARFGAAYMTCMMGRAS